jgi:acetylornithine/succinyldiaminopimelate/putrescine aminotransferase
MFGAELPDGVSGDIVGGLRKQGVYVSQRGSAIRFAPHLHVTETDIEQLLTALDEVLGTLKRH